MAVIATDNFNRANGSPGASWSLVSGTLFTIDSDLALFSQGVICLAKWAADAFPDDQYAQVVLVNPHNSTGLDGIGSGVALRLSGSPVNGYVIVAGSGGGTIRSIVSGTSSILTTWTAAGSDNDLLYAEIVGTVITVKRAGTTVKTYDTAGDASPIASGSAGLAHWPTPSNPLKVDDFEAGSVSGSAATGAIAITSVGASLAASGALGLTGAVAATSPAAGLSASGAVTVTASATLRAPAAGLSAAGGLAITAASTLTSQAATLATAGTLAITGTSAPAAQPATISASGALALTATAAVAAAPASLSASSLVTGGMVAAGARMSATATMAITGQVAVSPPSPSLSSRGALAITGTVSVTVPVATMRARGFNGEAPEAVYVANATTRQARVQIEAARRPAVGQERAFAAHLANETASRGRVEQETVMRAS
jgi:hypothetical protein